jgi:hypothetical protein
LVTDSTSILARWRNHFSQLFNVRGVTEVRQAEIDTAEPLVPEHIAFQFEMANEKLKRHKSPGTDQIPAEMIKAGGTAMHSEIHKPIKSEEWKELITVPIYKKDDKRGCCNYRDISLLPTTYKFLSNILLSRLTPYARKLLGIIREDCAVTGQLLIIYSAFIKYLRKNGNIVKQCIRYLQSSRKLMIQLGGRSCITFSKSWYPHETGRANKDVSQ